ncbi:hypothetical protein GCM10009099_28570 [Caenispirillum bisanense]
MSDEYRRPCRFRSVAATSLGMVMDAGDLLWGRSRQERHHLLSDNEIRSGGVAIQVQQQRQQPDPPSRAGRPHKTNG